MRIRTSICLILFLSLLCNTINIYGQSASRVFTFDKTKNKAKIKQGSHVILDFQHNKKGELIIVGLFNEEIDIDILEGKDRILSSWDDTLNYWSGASIFIAKYNEDFELIKFNKISRFDNLNG